MRGIIPAPLVDHDGPALHRMVRCGVKLDVRFGAPPPSVRRSLHQPHALAFREIAAFGTRLDHYKQNVYIPRWMIRSFANAEAERFFTTGHARRLPRDILRRAAMRLRQLDAATRIEDMRLPPSNRLEALKGDRAGQHSIRINDQWRICFRFANGDAFGVEIVDYH